MKRYSQLRLEKRNGINLLLKIVHFQSMISTFIGRHKWTTRRGQKRNLDGRSIINTNKQLV